jgi:hypothetical protein
MTDLSLEHMSSFCLFDLFLRESFRFCFHGGHLVHSHLTIASVVVMVKSIDMHVKVCVDSVWLVCNKSTVMAVTGVASNINLLRTFFKERMLMIASVLNQMSP